MLMPGEKVNLLRNLPFNSFHSVLYFSKGLVISKEKHTKKWKLDQQCKVEPEKPRDDDKWRWAHEQCLIVLRDSAKPSEKSTFSPCLQKLSEEKRKNLYEQCIDETCGWADELRLHLSHNIVDFFSCGIENKACPRLCSWFASLAEHCRKDGFSIPSWRHERFCRKCL